MNPKDIKEDKYYETSTGRIGKAYAVTDRKRFDLGVVDLLFEDLGCVFAGENCNPPSGIFKIESLKSVKKPK